MAKTVADVMKMVKDNEVKFVDFRFTDTRGKEQHVTVPVKAFDEDKFESRPRVRRLVDRRLEGHPGVGHAADARSEHGATSIRSSKRPTLIITCDVIEPADGKGYERDPRSLAKRAEAYLKSTGLGDAAYFGPEPEFFIFDARRRWNGRHVGLLLQDRFRGSAVVRRQTKFEGGNMGHRPARQGRLLPGAAGRLAAGHPLGDVPGARADGRRGRSAPPRSRERRPDARSARKFAHAGAARRLAADPEVRACRTSRTRTARRRPSCRSRSSATTARACTCTSRSGRAARTCSPATATPACRSSRCTTSAASSSTRKALNAITNPGTNSLQAPGAGLRGADQARLLGAQPLGVDPHSVRRRTRRAAASRCASRIRRAIRTSASPRC